MHFMPSLYTEVRFLAKLVNARYLSPINLTVSGDGKRLYVVAQESNALLIVDAERNKVINKIGVGEPASFSYTQ